MGVRGQGAGCLYLFPSLRAWKVGGFSSLVDPQTLSKRKYCHQPWACLPPYIYVLHRNLTVIYTVRWVKRTFVKHWMQARTLHVSQWGVRAREFELFKVFLTALYKVRALSRRTLYSRYVGILYRLQTTRPATSQLPPPSLRPTRGGFRGGFSRPHPQPTSTRPTLRGIPKPSSGAPTSPRSSRPRRATGRSS